MPDVRMKRTGTFMAVEADGREHMVFEFAQMLEHRDPTGHVSLVEGPKRYLCWDGRRVNYISKGKYEIVGDPTVPLFSDDPRAP